MKKKVIFSLGIFAVLLSAFYWTACQKEVSQEVLPLENHIQNQGTTDRDGECGQCNGDLKLRVELPGPGSQLANKYMHDWHIWIQTQACPSNPWVTAFEYDDDAPNAVGPNNLNWTIVPNLLAHDQYYRIVVKNENTLPQSYSPLSFSSSIRATGSVKEGFAGSNGLYLAPGETRIYYYRPLGYGPNVPSWKSDCGCAWDHDCGVVGGD